MAFADWTITEDLLKKMIEIVPGGKILEFGSGDGTEELAKYYKVYSIEDDPEWVNKHNSTYIHVPLVPYTEDLFPESWKFFKGNDIHWYNPEILKSKLESIKPEYDIILVDGPKGYRGGLLDYLDLFNLNITIVFDDVHDFYHRTLMEEISKKTNRPYDICLGYKKNYGIIK